MRFAALARYLRASKGALMHRWLERIRHDPAAVPSAQGLSEPQLQDHLPFLLEEIALTLSGESPPAVEAEGQAHGGLRWRQGYDIQEVLRELAVLRETLTEAVDAYAAGTPGLTSEEAQAAGRLIRQVIDRSAQAGVAQYHTEALSIRQQLWTALETANSQLKAANEQLEAVNSDLAAANVQLKAANEQKDRFLALVSHELRNPLAPILTAMQLLEFTEGSDPRLKRAREVIERQVQHQARLIDDLLDVSRIVQGKLTLRPEAHNLKAAIAYAVERCLPAIEAKGQELRVELPDEPLPVEADPVRLEQMVTNLLTNANKYTEAGGTIWLTAARVDGEVIVRVRDTGIGIAPEMLPRVFDLFTQGDTSLDRHQGGLGIGLALVKSLVELHGGMVEARSAGLGQGSEFEFRLPLGGTPAAPAPLQLTPPPLGLSRRRIVLVEDNPDARATLAEVLGLLGYHVVAAADGPAALRLAEINPPEVFVVDIGLPGMDGYELARRLRQLPGGDQARLIALSGYGGPGDKEQALEAGFDAHLTKPARIEELERLLDVTPERRSV